MRNNSGKYLARLDNSPLVSVIISAARAALETPFRHQGRTLRGMDCAGLIVWCAESAGLDYVDQRDYPTNPGNGRLEAALDMQPCLVRIPVATAEAGDVLLIKFAGDPQHLALHAGKMMIHAWEKTGKVCEHDLDEWRSGKIVAAYRFCEVGHE